MALQLSTVRVVAIVERCVVRRKERCPEHPEFEARTLHVPLSFLEKQTPGLRQWWDLKREYFDTVLFFKVGKFYEMYHMDAMVCARELGLTMMRVCHNPITQTIAPIFRHRNSDHSLR